MVMSTLQLLRDNPDPTADEVRHGIAGNLCRCTGYQLIVEGVLEAARMMRDPARASA
jgi:carbon-monoxide dehydrogenase small subunit